MPKLNVVLISTYEMGRQPFGLASPAAWLQEVPAEVTCLDLSVEPLLTSAILRADLVAFYVPMHMATRMAVPVLARVRQINPEAVVCFYGLYASENAAYLQGLGADFCLGGEFEQGLVDLARRLLGEASQPENQVQSLVLLRRQHFLVPDRSGLPALRKYAQLELANGKRHTVGYAETSRGCKHLCRHCPIVPVYQGQFRIVQRDVVLADIQQQVAAGARHITFGDPDFFNGPGHALPIVQAMHVAHPDLTYDVTIKVEHLLSHARHLRELQQTGCLFVTTAVESFDDQILKIFDKGHTQRDFERALDLCRDIGLQLVPTFVAFTPWTTIESYRQFLAEIARLKLVAQVPPIQYTIRLLIPPGSRLLELSDLDGRLKGFDESMLSYRWESADPVVDRLQRELELLVMESSGGQADRAEIFQHIWERAHHQSSGCATSAILPQLSGFSSPVPKLTEPWYC